MSQAPQVRAERLEDLLVKTSRTFALSIPALPEPTRREVTIAYLLFRIADTLEDATEWSAASKLEALAGFDRLLTDPTASAARALSRRWVERPPLTHAGYLELLAELPAVLSAFESLAPGARALVCEHTRRTTARMMEFVGRSGADRPLELRDVAELRDYCYAVAGIVGEMLTELFVLDSATLSGIAPFLRERAARFGEALQLVNILKDSAADVVEGRHYLPPAVDPAEVFALARADLGEARRYVLALQDAAAPRGIVAFTALPVLLARNTLDRVERDGPGAKLTRPEVRRIALELEAALERGAPAIPEGLPPAPDARAEEGDGAGSGPLSHP